MCWRRRSACGELASAHRHLLRASFTGPGAAHGAAVMDRPLEILALRTRPTRLTAFRSRITLASRKPNSQGLGAGLERSGVFCSESPGAVARPSLPQLMPGGRETHPRDEGGKAPGCGQTRRTVALELTAMSGSRPRPLCGGPPKPSISVPAPALLSASQCECLLIVPVTHMTDLLARRHFMSLAAAKCAGAASATQAQPQKRVLRIASLELAGC
jgi:hypothetical protein